MKYLACILAIACISAGPKHPEAVSAKKEYDTYLKWAEHQHDAAKRKAVLQYQGRLKRALSFAIKGQDLEEANRIKTAIDGLGSGKIIKHKPKPRHEKPGRIDLKKFAGNWIFKYHNQTTHTRTIRADGTMVGGRLLVLDGHVIMDHGKVYERITFAGDRLFVEHFNPKSTYRRGVTAPTMGEGIRSK